MGRKDINQTNKNTTGQMTWYQKSLSFFLSFMTNFICSVICFCILVASYIASNMDPDQSAPWEQSDHDS